MRGRDDQRGEGEIGGRPRLVHVTTTDISLALLLGPQLEAFAAAGYEVIGASAPGPFVSRLEALGILHVALRHATRAMAPAHDAAALSELTRLFRRLRPDIVHTHNPKPGVYGRLAARAAGVPVIVNTVHGLYATPEDRLARRALVYGLERLAATCSDAELVQNPEDVTTLQQVGVPADRITLLGNGIDLDRFHPNEGDRASVRAELGAEAGDVVVGVVGRLVWEKGHREVFETARVLRRRRPDVRVVVVGPTDESKADAVAAGDLAQARADGVRFLGHRDDVERLYRGMDLYVLASYREGFPRSAMEAAATGLPVVATDIRGCRQVVDDGETGRLVQVRNADALAAAVEELADDPDLRAAMGRAALAKATAQFDQQRVIGTTLATYERLLGWSPRPQDMTGGPMVEHAGDRDIEAAAELHAGQITGGFLASLGAPFLSRLYRRALRERRSFVLVVRDEAGGIAGFLVGTEDTGALYRAFLVHDAVAAAAVSSPRLIRGWRQALETLAYGRSGTGDKGTGTDAELLAIAVRPDQRGRGVGRALVDGFLAELRRRGVSEAHVVAGEQHAAAQRLYEAAGFSPVACIQVHGNESSTVLAWP